MFARFNAHAYSGVVHICYSLAKHVQKQLAPHTLAHIQQQQKNAFVRSAPRTYAVLSVFSALNANAGKNKAE